MKLSRVGIDLAKNVYQLHGVDRHGTVVWQRRLRRNQWLSALLERAQNRVVQLAWKPVPVPITGLESFSREATRSG